MQIPPLAKFAAEASPPPYCIRLEIGALRVEIILKDFWQFVNISTLQFPLFTLFKRLTSIKNGVKMKEPMGKEILKEEDHGFWQ